MDSILVKTLDNWSEITRETMDADGWAWIPMLSYVVITGFIVVNLVIAVICDAIAALNDDDKARVHGTYDESVVSLESKDDESQSSEGVKAEINGSVDEAAGEPKSESIRVVRGQMDSLYCRVDELTRIQEETFLAMSQLSACLQQKKKRKGQCGGE